MLIFRGVQLLATDMNVCRSLLYSSSSYHNHDKKWKNLVTHVTIWTIQDLSNVLKWHDIVINVQWTLYTYLVIDKIILD